MLGKLIKNDIKSAARTVVFIYFALLIAMGAMGVSLIFDVFIAGAWSSVALILISLVAVLVTIFTVFMDFRKTMFGDRGYLTNSLPVTSVSLLFSKMVTSMFWILISYAVFTAATIGVAAFQWNEKNQEVNLAEILTQLFSLSGLPSFDVLKKVLIITAIKLIFVVGIAVSAVFFSMTLSNIRPFQSLGLIGTILFFFIIVGLFALAGSQITKVFDLNILVNADASLGIATTTADALTVRESGGFTISLSQTIFHLLLCVVFFVINSELLEKKVNLK